MKYNVVLKTIFLNMEELIHDLEQANLPGRWNVKIQYATATKHTINCYLDNSKVRPVRDSDFQTDWMIVVGLTAVMYRYLDFIDKEHMEKCLLSYNLSSFQFYLISAEMTNPLHRPGFGISGVVHQGAIELKGEGNLLTVVDLE